MRRREEMSVVEVEVEVRVLNGLDGFQVRYDGYVWVRLRMAQWHNGENGNRRTEIGGLAGYGYDDRRYL